MTHAEKRFDWPLCYDAEKFVLRHIEAFTKRNGFARRLAERMQAETGTLLLDWVDYLTIPQSEQRKARELGFTEDPLSETPAHQKALWHPEAMLPRLLIERESASTTLAIRCESIADFIVAHELTAEPEGAPLSRFRRVLVGEENGTRLEAVERRAYHGPRPTPAIRDGKVFVHNTDGYLVCLDLKSGAKVWSRLAKSEFKSSATWHGCVASPLLTDHALILPVGGTNNAGIVAFALDDGHTLWQFTSEKATASTPVLTKLDGKNQLVIVTREALHGLDPDTGQDFWRLPTRRQTSGNVYAASPVVFDDKIFLSGWYKLGAMFIRLQNGQPEKLWQLDDALSSHYACPIVRDGYAYGFHGHAWEQGGPTLRCIELATGKVMWEQPKLGSGTIIRAGNQLLILSDTGELQLATATPRQFKIKCRVQVVGRPTRSYPAIADGFAYIKGPRQLVCVDLRDH